MTRARIDFPAESVVVGQRHMVDAGRAAGGAEIESLGYGLLFLPEVVGKEALHPVGGVPGRHRTPRRGHRHRQHPRPGAVGR